MIDALAAGVYLVATVALWRGARRLAYATVLFELAGPPEPLAREAMRRAMHKLPMKCRFITREVGD